MAAMSIDEFSGKTAKSTRGSLRSEIDTLVTASERMSSARI
jgi:hypothetical protein